MKQYRKEMKGSGMIVSHVHYRVALLTYSNLDESTKLNIESVAKNNSGNEITESRLGQQARSRSGGKRCLKLEKLERNT